MSDFYLTLDLHHGCLYLGHTTRVVELKTERRQNLIQCQLHGQHAVGFGGGTCGFGDAQQRIAQPAISELADQETPDFTIRALAALILSKLTTETPQSSMMTFRTR